jgi:hypothetical protein
LFVAFLVVAHVQYNYHLKNEALLQQLDSYKTVTVRRTTIFPSADVFQISLKDDFTDDDLTTISTFPQLAHVTDVYVDNCRVTDKSLDQIGKWPQLTYLFIESDVITDVAIMQFEDLHPNCTVIPYGRDW